VKFSTSHFNAAALACLTAAPMTSWACATCGCTLNSDAAFGHYTEPGWRLSLEYDYIHQDQLRSKTHEISVVPARTELEHDTLNRYVTAGVDYSPTADWNINVRVPYVIRTHSTYGDYDPGEPLPPLSSSHSSSLGDVRLIGNYQGFLPAHNLGVQLGIKLPTGRFGTAVDFRSGPAAGTPLDASLQPGTGSTDVIVGAYYYQAVGYNLDFFTNLQYQSAVSSKQDQPGEDFRPGDTTTLSFGLRYEESPYWVPQVQMNFLHKNVDRGALADITDTAGYVAYFSPGVTFRVVGGLHLYAFGQLPVYSDLVGYQVFPRYTFSIGASYEL